MFSYQGSCLLGSLQRLAVPGFPPFTLIFLYKNTLFALPFPDPRQIRALRRVVKSYQHFKHFIEFALYQNISKLIKIS